MGRIKSLVKIDDKGRVTIPQHIREPLGVGPGMYFEVVADLEGRQIVLKPLFRGRAEGVTVEVRVRLNEIKEVEGIINKCVDGGYDVISLNCLYGEAYECTLNIYAIDDAQASKLRELLSEYEVVINP